MDNRVIDCLKKGLDKGENAYFFYGDYIHDWYMYDLYHGICDMKNTLKRYFLENDLADYFFYCKNDIFEAFHKEKSQLRECSNSLFQGTVNKQSASNGMSRNNRSKANGTHNQENDKNQKEARDAIEQSGAAGHKSAFQKAVKYCEEHQNEKLIFFFEDYEWTTGMYRSSNDEFLGYIEDVKKLISLKNVYVVISIEEIQMLKKYNFIIDGENAVMIGSPAVEEVFSTYLRLYIRKYQSSTDKRRKVHALNLDFFKELTAVSEAVSAGEKSLKDAVRIFERVMQENNGVLDQKDFMSSLDKIVEEKVYLDDVILNENLKEDVVTRVDKFLTAKNVSEVTKGMILTGPPGTGKTYLVKALANEKNCYFMSASLADLKAEYVGQSAPKIKRLFQKARANAPTILFIDEADTVFPGRDLTSGDTDSFTKDMVNQFLVEMDGVLTGESRVFVVAATNRVNVLDNAIKSRLGKPIVIPLPDKAQRKALFTKLLQKENMNFKSFHFSDEFLDKTNHMSGRDIKDFVDNMRKEAQKQTRNISDYKTEAEAKKLFYDCLRLFEEDLVRKLESSLDITINRPSDKVRYNDIIGCEEIKRAIDRQVEMFDFRARRRADEYDIKMKQGILVYGPPGNGKSQLAQAAANEHGLYFMKITSDTFTKVSLSEQNKTLVKIFNSALQLSEICGEEIKGVLLFFDEFDALASGELLDPRVRGTMLTQLDDQDTLRNPNTKVLFMAATNYYEKLDEAMIRAGRIDEKLEMRDPSPENGTQMLIQFCSQNPKVEPLDEEIAKSAYDNYANNMKEVKIRRFVASQKIILSLTGYDDQKLEKAAELRFENERPSGADLRNYANNLISTAYYRNSFTKDMKLHITEDVVKDVIATYYDKVSHEE